MENIAEINSRAKGLFKQISATMGEYYSTEFAKIIADYETLLAKYDISYGYFERASKAWAEEFNAWFLDETGTIDQPRDAPHPPSRPTPPPNWAEVRRP